MAAFHEALAQFDFNGRLSGGLQELDVDFSEIVHEGSQPSDSLAGQAASQCPRRGDRAICSLDTDQLRLSAIVAAELHFKARKLGLVKFASTIEAWLAGFDVRPWPSKSGRESW